MNDLERQDQKSNRQVSARWKTITSEVTNGKKDFKAWLAAIIEIDIQYQIVGGKGGYKGHLELTGSTPHGGGVIVIDDDLAETLAMQLAKLEAETAKRRAESESTGEPVHVYRGKFVGQ
ncbi:MAG: hypothetical protein H6817_07450 [Phycisphaerales bacterium]|nr:hypothetical protein [Phycisphaerales bacterium]